MPTIGIRVPSTKPNITMKAQNDAKTKKQVNNKWFLTVSKESLTPIIIEYCICENYKTGYPQNRLDREAAPVRPKCCAPLPRGQIVCLDKCADSYHEAKNSDYFRNQLHCSITRSFLLSNAEGRYPTG